ncbi:hypothetical protein H0H92_008353 [Tricholoma furcatifolium]|nr:hypothetical protein H0H92_008353 [Tricholoma furcatifolium]
MGEIINVIVAFAVIVFIFRWATSGGDTTEQRSAADTLGFRPKPVTQVMMRSDNVRYDLLRTGSVELTSNKILERGFLDAPPPAYYTLFPRDTAPARPAAATATARPTDKKPQGTLISRFNLQDRVSKEETIQEDKVGGKATWEDSAEKREASLRERKAQMILAARQRMLAAQQSKSP